jgi:hypothetical protein
MDESMQEYDDEEQCEEDYDNEMDEEMMSDSGYPYGDEEHDDDPNMMHLLNRQ